MTFSKASEAALAIEEMNGKCVFDNPRPLKVILSIISLILTIISDKCMITSVIRLCCIILVSQIDITGECIFKVHLQSDD